MIFFMEMLLTFVFLNAMFFMGFPPVELDQACGSSTGAALNSNLITQKILLFFVMFVFSYVFQLMYRLMSSVKMEHSEMFKIAFDKAIYAVLGYTLYADYTLRYGPIGAHTFGFNSGSVPGSIQSNLMSTLNTYNNPSGVKVDMFQNMIASLFVVVFTAVISVAKIVYISGDSNCITQNFAAATDKIMGK